MSVLSGRIDVVERKWAARCRLLWCAIAKCYCAKLAVGVNEPKHDDDRQGDGEEDHRLGPVRRLVLSFFSAENARDILADQAEGVTPAAVTGQVIGHHEPSALVRGASTR